jgi:hypothetical protein
MCNGNMVRASLVIMGLCASLALGPSACSSMSDEGSSEPIREEMYGGYNRDRAPVHQGEGAGAKQFGFEIDEPEQVMRNRPPSAGAMKTQHNGATARVRTMRKTVHLTVALLALGLASPALADEADWQEVGKALGFVMRPSGPLALEPQVGSKVTLL